MAKKNGLGRGLEALLPDVEETLFLPLIQIAISQGGCSIQKHWLPLPILSVKAVSFLPFLLQNLMIAIPL